jgi:hypothetical protein
MFHMQRSRAPWWLYPAVAVILFHVLLLVFAEFYGPEPPGWQLEPNSQGYLVTAVSSGSPAAQAGIQPGDVLRQWDGSPLADNIEVFMLLAGPGQTYRLEFDRSGVERGARITLGYRSWRTFFMSAHPGEALFHRIWRPHYMSAHPAAHVMAILTGLLALVAGLLIVRARSRDWVSLGFALALLLVPIGSHGAPYGFYYLVLSMPMAIQVLFHLASHTVYGCLVPTLLACVLNFPRPLATPRWTLPLLFLPFLMIFPILTYEHWVLMHNPLTPPPTGLVRLILIIYRLLVVTYGFGAVVAIGWNYRRLVDGNERRKLRVIILGFAAVFAGGVIGTVIHFPPVAEVIGNSYVGSLETVAFSLGHITWPVCVAYAILRHRVFDIRIIVRQGLQYAAARGLLLSIAPLCALALVADLLLHGDQPLLRILAERGWLYAVIGLGAFLAHRRQAEWLVALDRRFFRERYDAQRILTAVAEEISHTSDFRQAASRVVTQIDAALHPQFTRILLRRPGEPGFTAFAGSGGYPDTVLPAASRLMALMRVLGKPVDCSRTTGSWLRGLPSEETDYLRRAQIEWIFPISVAEGKQEAILVLGPRRSEEPYSAEDQQLLEAVCATLAILLERSALSAPKAAAEPDETLAGRYRLVRCLGSGGMGTVYEAFDITLDRRVAVKLIRADLTGNHDASARFVREAKAAAFGHPNVVTIHDFGVAADGRAFLIMELLEGVTLRQELRKEVRLDVARATAILRDVCAGVEAAHSRRLLHRDLKPENIFIIHAPGLVAAKILDFGIAKPLSDGSETMTLNETGPGVVVGTPQYVSPEQLRGEQPTERWDLWSLAVVAYEMLTGSYPFATASGDWRQSVLSARVIPTRIHVPGAPDSWDRFFTSAFAAEPAERPASAAALLAAFRRATAPASVQ